MAERRNKGRTNDAPPGQLGELIAISVLDDVEDIIVQSARRECVAKGEQCVHAIGSLVNLIGGRCIVQSPSSATDRCAAYLVVLVTSCVVLSHSEDEI